MITQTKKFYYVESKKDFIIVILEDFPDGPLPLIWNNQGLSGLVRVERVANMIEQLKDDANLPKLDENKKVGGVHWDTLQLTAKGTHQALFKLLR